MKRNRPSYKSMYEQVEAEKMELIKKLKNKDVNVEDNRYELKPLKFEAIVGQTEKAWAIQVGIDEDSIEWFPKSQCAIAGPNTIMSPVWLLKEKELLEEALCWN
jgi:hypothetical protein